MTNLERLEALVEAARVRYETLREAWELVRDEPVVLPVPAVRAVPVAAPPAPEPPTPVLPEPTPKPVAKKPDRNEQAAAETTARRRLVIARFLRERGHATPAEIAAACGLGEGAVDAALGCNLFAPGQTGAYALTPTGRDHLQNAERGGL